MKDLWFFAIFVALSSSLGLDYSMTFKVVDQGTEILYPAWPVNLKCGFWEIQPNTVYKGGSGMAQARDKLGFCGSNLQIFYNDRTGTQVLRFQAITGFNQENSFKYTAHSRFHIEYKMKCGETEVLNEIVKEGHPCEVEVYVSYKEKEEKKSEDL